MRYFETLSKHNDIFHATLSIMERTGWPYGGGSYLIDGKTLSYNKSSFPKQELLYKTVESFDGEPRILEIGVYAAHSLFIMLLANQRSKFTLIDPCNYGFEKECVGEVKSYFEANIDLHEGRSNEVLPHLHWPYDIIHVDGGHGMEDVLYDFENAKRLSYEKTLVVVDDWDGIEPQLPKEVKDTFEVIEVANCPNPNAVIRFK